MLATMQDIKREEKIAAAKRKLKQFKQKRGKGSKPSNKDANSASDLPTNGDHISEDFRNQRSLRDEIIATTLADDSPVSNTEDLAQSSGVEQNIQDAVTPPSDLSKDVNAGNDDSKHSLPVQLSSASEPSNTFNVTANGHQHDSNEALQNSSVDDKGDSIVPPVSHHTASDQVLMDGASKDSLGDATEREGKVTLEDETKEGFDALADVHHTSNLSNGANMTNSDSASATESLLQISTKLNGIATEVQAVTEGEYQNGSSASIADAYVVSELECRNQKLAEQLAAIVRQKQDLLVQVEKLSQQVNDLHARMETERQQLAVQNIQDQTAIQQRLQVQMQTIGILVAEKQELQHQVHEAQTGAVRDQHARQRCQDELQDAKVRVQMLERELTTKTDTVNSLTAVKHELEADRKELQLSVSKLGKTGDESQMHLNELAQKLAAKESDCHRLTAEVTDLHEKLAMAEVLLQQLSSSSGVSAETQVNELQSERESLNQKLIEYQQAFEQLTSEREQLARQYEDANQQMQAEVTELSLQISTLENEKSVLIEKEEGLREKVKNLEQQLTERSSDPTELEQRATVEDMAGKLQELHVNVESLTTERNDLLRKLDAQLRNNERLARLNEEQEMQLSNLNQQANDSVVSTEEHQRLLDQLQSEKTTISRALMQNKQLKQQLEEMQEGFIKLSNDKMELATALSTMQHAKKDTVEENENVRVQLAGMRQTLDAKNQNLVELQNRLLELQSNESDNLELSQQASPNPAVHEEIVSLQDTISLLTEQNTNLKEMVTKLQHEVDSLEVPARGKENEEPVEVLTPPAQSSPDVSKTNDQVEMPDHQMAEERTLLLNRIEELEEQKKELSQAIENLRQPRTSDEAVSKDEHETLVHNMSLLQDRFTKVMSEKVESLNKIEELEHINLQLQSECDTIGEYITLYHNQRQLLKQRHHEKDEYVSSIAQEREAMQQKFEKLQTLVLTLVNAREMNGQPIPQLAAIPEMRNDISVEMNDSMAPETSTSSPSEWPDMLEDEDNKPRMKSRPDLLPENAQLSSRDQTGAESSSESGGDEQPTPESYPGKTQRLDNGEQYEQSKTNTANQIIHLLEQMQRPVYTKQNDKPQGFCLRYMGQYTAI